MTYGAQGELEGVTLEAGRPEAASMTPKGRGPERGWGTVRLHEVHMHMSAAYCSEMGEDTYLFCLLGSISEEKGRLEFR